MDAEFWTSRWRENATSFHQGRANARLEAHFDALALAPGARVLVPLCGKAVDMTWLAERGCEVVGVELSDIACRSYFEERGVVYRTRERGAFIEMQGAGVTLWCGDFFAFGPAECGTVDAVYDRAALVALPESMRAGYVRHLLELVPDRAPMLVVSFDYDQSQMQGPPFSVSEADIRALYEPLRTVTHLGGEDVLARAEPLRQRGLTALEEHAFLVD